MNEILEKIEIEIKKRNIAPSEISKVISSIPELTNRRIIYGYASVSIVDRENQKISIPALKDAVKRFMAEEKYRLINVFHSDATVGRILPKWTDPKTGRVYLTEVDDKGWLVVCELRDDIELADKVWEEILKGNLKSFSIAGSSKRKHDGLNHGMPYTEIDELDLYECTICSVPVNQLSMFETLWDPKRVQL